MTRYVVAFDALGVEDVELVGGKNANLGELTGAGFPVPPGFAVTTHAHEAGLTDEVAAAIVDGCGLLGDVPVAVRSSAVAEDMPDASFAGVQDTYLWLRGADAVLDGVRRCWASYWNAEAVAYRKEHGVAAGGMCVAVQRMVDARVAGVMFTLNPVSGDPSTIAIDASWGLGVTVVGGEVTPDSFLVSKVTRARAQRRRVEGARGGPGRRRDGDRVTGGRTGSSRASVPRAGRARTARGARPPGRASLRAAHGHRMGDRPRRRALAPAGAARDGVEHEAVGAAISRRDGGDPEPVRSRRDEEGRRRMSRTASSAPVRAPLQEGHGGRGHIPRRSRSVRFEEARA
jgi:hypothetical protein